MSEERKAPEEAGIVTEEGGPGRVLLTGASGFVGSQCLEVLRAGGWEVHAVTSTGLAQDQESAPAPDGGAGTVEWHVADLLDPDVTSVLVETVHPSHLLHLAWVSNRGYADSPENHLWAKASLHLVERFAAAGGRRAVLTGTCAEYDWEYGVMVEGETPLRPSNVYGECKKALSEGFFELLRAEANRQALTGAWARLFFLYGPGQLEKRLVSAVITSLLAGEPARCSHGEQIRDYLYVRDAAEALVALLASPVGGSINIGSGHGTVLKELIGEIARQLDGEELVELGALPAPANEAPRVVADIGRLSGEVGWNPRFELATAVGETVAWWRQRTGV